MITIVNGNLGIKDLDLLTSELIYWIESKDLDVQYVILRNIVDKEHCKNINDLIENSEMVMYIHPISTRNENRLEKYFEQYNGYHPPIYLILHADHLLSVEEVDEAIKEVEAFAEKNDTQILNVSYMKDAIDEFKTK